MTYKNVLNLYNPFEVFQIIVNQFEWYSSCYLVWVALHHWISMYRISIMPLQWRYSMHIDSIWCAHLLSSNHIAWNVEFLAHFSLTNFPFSVGGWVSVQQHTHFFTNEGIFLNQRIRELSIYTKLTI